MSHDDIITIHADIFQITDAAVLICCEGDETWLPLSQIDFCGERGDTDVPISLPEWLGDDKGLSDGDGMCRATVTDFHTGLPKNEDDSKNCRNCALLPLADNESGPMPEELKPCPACESKVVNVEKMVPGVFATYCHNKDCEMRGPKRRTRGKALAAWNALPRSPHVTPNDADCAGCPERRGQNPTPRPEEPVS